MSMRGSVTIPVRSPDFQRSFVALSYFFGARGAALGDALQALPLQAPAADLLRGLGHAERSERAKALGAELARLSAALDERGLWR
jgi:hypothetical protein